MSYSNNDNNNDDINSLSENFLNLIHLGLDINHLSPSTKHLGLDINYFSPSTKSMIRKYKSPPKTTSKHQNFLTGGLNVSMIPQTIYNENFFKDDYKIISSNIEKPDVIVRSKIDIDKDDDLFLENDRNYDLLYNKIYKNFDIDEQYITRSNIFEDQIFINSKMFKILIDWIVEIHGVFNHSLETLYLTVHLIKEYIAKVKNIRISKLQLLGITCYFIASKYEEEFCVNTNKLVHLTDNAYTKIEIYEFETEVLSALNFDIKIPTTYFFLRRYLQAAKFSRRNMLLAIYISERLLQEAAFHKYLPSELAAACIYLSQKILLVKNWSNRLIYYTNYTEDHISKIADEIEVTCRTVDESTNAVYNKYRSIKYKSVSLLFN